MKNFDNKGGTVMKNFHNMTGAQLLEVLGNPKERVEVRFRVEEPGSHAEWTLRWNRGRGRQVGMTFIHLFADVDDTAGETGHYWRGGHGHYLGTSEQQFRDFKLLRIADWQISE